MLWRIAQAAIIAGVVGFLLVVIIGPVLTMLQVPIAVFLGGVCVNWGWAIGVFAGLIWFFWGGAGWLRPPSPPPS
jgi:hypothetical protein